MKSKGKERSVPPKWCDTRWCGWRDVSEWWCEYFDLFVEFLTKEINRPNPKGPAEYNVTLRDNMKRGRRSLLARMIFAVDHMQGLGALINRCQEAGAGPILVPSWKQVRHQLGTLIAEKSWSPRLQALLEGWTRSEPTIDALVTAADLVAKKMDSMQTKHAKMLLFFHHLSVVDPRNLATHVSTWAEVSGPLHMPPDLRDEWEAYAKMDPLKAKGVQDVSAFWHAQDTPLALHIQQLLDVPTALDAVERTFSKAGVLDTKQRNQSRPLLRKASMMLYCNGDVEGRFSHR